MAIFCVRVHASLCVRGVILLELLTGELTLPSSANSCPLGDASKTLGHPVENVGSRKRRNRKSALLSTKEEKRGPPRLRLTERLTLSPEHFASKDLAFYITAELLSPSYPASRSTPAGAGLLQMDRITQHVQKLTAPENCSEKPWKVARLANSSNHFTPKFNLCFGNTRLEPTPRAF